MQYRSPGRLRTVREYVTQMRIAIGAAHFGAGHEERTVGKFADGILADRSIETRPSGAAVEFGIRFKQRFAATYAGKGSGSLFVLMRSGKRAFGPMLSSNRKLFRGELRAPFGLALVYFRHLRLRYYLPIGFPAKCAGIALGGDDMEVSMGNPAVNRR